MDRLRVGDVHRLRDHCPAAWPRWTAFCARPAGDRRPCWARLDVRGRPRSIYRGFFLFGLARFRAIRYRLSRTWWRGIRGGSNDGGWNYARKAIGYYLVTFLLGGIFYPWAQAKLWNERWRKMSFGPTTFTPI
ncbi:DUF898 family protein [Sphingomonas daechungensis]|uniref:DUF898 family protein n=1 Tax=Sphingomonas daechungensis TaxID=1176646 RepID=UPI0037D9D676